MDSFNFDIIRKKFDEEKINLPLKLANATKNFFIEQNFNDQQFNGKKWQDRKDKKNDRALLVASGRLRRDVANSLTVATWDVIKFEVKNPYGAYHNEGTEKIPQRQFMGHSKDLEKMQLKMIEKELSKIF